MKRIYEFDIIRVIATCTIFICHLHYFTSGILIDTLHSYDWGTPGLTIFFFLSGFLIYKYNFETKNHFLHFWRNKLSRLLPPLYVSIIIYFIVEYLGLGVPEWDIPLSIFSVLTNAFVLQIFFVGFHYFAFWYISALLVLFAIHSIIKYCSKNNMYVYIACTFVAYALLIALYLIDVPFNAWEFDYRIIQYFFVFIIGYLCSNFLHSEDISDMIFPIYLLTIILVSNYVKPMAILGSLIFSVNGTILATVFVLFAFTLATKLDKWKTIPRMPSILMRLSYASYSAYLLHYPIFSILRIILNSAYLNQGYIFILVGFPIVFLCGYILQYSIDLFFAKCLIVFNKNNLLKVN